MGDLRKEIEKVVAVYLKEKTRAYVFRDEKTRDRIETLVEDFNENLFDEVLSLDREIDMELEEAELNYDYFVKKETYDDMENFIYHNQL